MYAFEFSEGNAFAGIQMKIVLRKALILFSKKLLLLHKLNHIAKISLVKTYTLMIT